jgi:hypothetical protein
MRENNRMAVQSSLPFADLIPAELAADTQAVLDKLAGHKPLDPETGDRIVAEADKIREELRRKHGVLDIGVPAIRELRDS